MSAARRRSMAELLAAQSGIEDTAPERPAATPAAAVPAPYEAAGDGALTPAERADLDACEAALDHLRVAFAVAGRALQVIRDARLYRDGHDTFEDYVEARWDMSRPQAYRLIDAWPLAELLSPMGDINERQVRELLPVAAEHGQEAAAAVYRAVAGDDGTARPVTARLLHGAVTVLPPGPFDPAAAAAAIRAWLAGQAPPRNAPDPVQRFEAQAARMLRVLHGSTLRAAAGQDPAAVRKVIADMRALLDEIEQGTG